MINIAIVSWMHPEWTAGHIHRSIEAMEIHLPFDKVGIYFLPSNDVEHLFQPVRIHTLLIWCGGAPVLGGPVINLGWRRFYYGSEGRLRQGE